MRTQAQSEASRQNGGKSHGPKTAAGKANSSKNSYRHGLTAKRSLGTAENPEVFIEHLEAYHEKFEPMDDVERNVVDAMALAHWHERRAWSKEAALLDIEMDRMSKKVDEKYGKIDHAARYALAFKSLCDRSNAMHLLIRYENTHRRAFKSNLENLIQMRSALKPRPSAPVLDPEPNSRTSEPGTRRDERRTNNDDRRTRRKQFARNEPSNPNKTNNRQQTTSYKQRTTTYEQRTTSYDQRATNYDQRATSYDQRATSYEQRATSYDQRATSYDQRATSYDQRATSHELRTTSYEQRTTSYDQRATSYELRTTSYDGVERRTNNDERRTPWRRRLTSHIAAEYKKIMRFFAQPGWGGRMQTTMFAGSAALLVASLTCAQPLPDASQRSLVNQYCAGCHNDNLKSGDFSWSKIDLAHPEQNAGQVERAIRMLRAGMMPPPGARRPDAVATKAFAVSLETAIDQAAAQHPNPGRPPLHRLNRTEYARSVRDLLSIDVDVSSLLPPDDMSHGFDNMAGALTMSPTLMEGFIRAADRISRQAVGDTEAAALTKTYRISRVFSQTRHVEGTPFGTRGGISVVHHFPADGEYIFKLGFYYSPTGPLFGLNQGKGQQIEVAVNGDRVALLDINPKMNLANDGIKTPPIQMKAGPQRISASFLQNADGPIEDEVRMFEQTLVDVSAGTIPGMTTLPHLHELSINGPAKVLGISDTPSRRRIFTCRPAPGSDEVPCAKKIIASLARQAYRRPATEADLEALLSFYQSGRNTGDFETGIRTALQAILASPEFVFRFERTPPSVVPGPNYRISDLELASRLSYFLWSTAPDETLIAVASQGKLRDPAVLEKQVRRMLADPRSEMLSTNFASQWLHLQNLKDASPDLLIYPDFDRTLSQAIFRETQLLFDSIMREDRPLTDLLTSNYTFVNERLAKHYGIPNILGNRFRRITLTDPNRFGLLGQGSILMLTSTATRTSPVQRGKYVMEVLLGTPPPPPPPNIPALKEIGDLAKPVSVRERLEQHRENPACAGCHKLMDPIGFALENFDAVGVWRTNDSGFVIDASGQMFDGAKLSGPVSLRQAILNRSDVFIGTFTENLLAYGLGRVLEPYDMPAVRAITRETARNNNRFSSFILGVVKSVPFQMRRAEEPEPQETKTDVYH